MKPEGDVTELIKFHQYPQHTVTLEDSSQTLSKLNHVCMRSLWKFLLTPRKTKEQNF